MPIKIDSKRSALFDLSFGDADAPLEAHKVRVSYRAMTAREQAAIRAHYAALAAKAAASTTDAHDLAALNGDSDIALDMARALILDLQDEAGDPITFDGLTWREMSEDQRRDASVGLGSLVVEILKLAGGQASARLLGK